MDVTRSDSAASLKLVVKDTGIGMSPEHIAKIGEAFAQEDQGISRQFGGSGLGLAIVRQILNSCGGTMSIESAKGAGTTITISVPLKAAEKESKAAPESATKSGNVSIAGETLNLRVLVVEDNGVNIKVITSILKKLGCPCAVAENGQLAVERILAGESYDLILMDLQMPVMDGLTATRTLRRSPSAKNLPPIIALSANAEFEMRQTITDAGMDGYLEKPLAMDKLIQILRKAQASKSTA